jgi:hypothetical protein
MTIFNTIKKAEHYVKYINKSKAVRNHNWHFGYMWEYLHYEIDYDNKRVIKSYGEDGCGCGCDTYTWHDLEIIGRIK